MNLEYSEFEPLLRRLTSLFRRYIDRRSNNKKQPRSQPWRPPRNTPISNQKSLESRPRRQLSHPNHETRCDSPL